jgi:hypothetical protein
MPGYPGESRRESWVIGSPNLIVVATTLSASDFVLEAANGAGTTWCLEHVRFGLRACIRKVAVLELELPQTNSRSKFL